MSAEHLDGVAGHTLAVLAGEKRAADFVAALRDPTTGDELSAAIERIHDRRELASFCRFLQKHFERAIRV
jgi:hypothetical protein